MFCDLYGTSLPIRNFISLKYYNVGHHHLFFQYFPEVVRNSTYLLNVFYQHLGTSLYISVADLHIVYFFVPITLFYTSISSKINHLSSPFALEPIFVFVTLDTNLKTQTLILCNTVHIQHKLLTAVQ